MDILEIFNPFSSTIAVGGITGFAIGYFIRKIMKVILFILGGVLSLLMYLQYQGLIIVNIDKVQHFTNIMANSITNFTSNTILYSGTNFGNIPIGVSDLAISFTGSMAIGITAGLLRG